MASSRKVRPSEQLALIGAERNADAELAESFADGVGGHAEDAGNGEHCAQQAQNTESNRCHAGSEEG